MYWQTFVKRGVGGWRGGSPDCATATRLAGRARCDGRTPQALCETLAEAFRVLKPGGRLAVSDVVVRGAVPAEIRKSMELWMGCIAGALEEQEYAAKRGQAGFEEVSIEPTRVNRADDARSFLAGLDLDVDAIAPQTEGKFLSAFVRARKLAGAIRA